MRVSELVAALKTPPDQRHQVRRVLDQLLQEGSVVRLRKDRLVLPSEANLVAGRIQMNQRGFGFVTPDLSSGETRDRAPLKSPSDIFIPAEDTGVAMHEDRVLVRLHAAPRSRSDPQPRLRGRVIRVLERAHPTLLGVLQKGDHFYYVVPDDPRIGRDIYVNLQISNLKPKEGDRVIVKLAEWKNRHVNPEGVILEIIGRSDDPRLDILVIVKKFRFRADFPADVLSQAEAIPEAIPEAERARRLDLTRDRMITIDPDDARDYDDALSLKKLPNGHWLLGVHIADVSHYVQPHSALDREAFQRGNSVYLPDRVIPMLPPRLSNELCSLREGVDRLTRSVFFEMNRDGTENTHWFQDTIIHSAARLTYQQALSIIGNQKSENKGQKSEAVSDILHPLLRDLWSLASKVRALRFSHGSLDLDFPELKIFCDDHGVPQRVEKQENDISHQLVEEFMLLANEAVAAESRRNAVPSIYRIHDEPDPEKLEQFRDLAQANGYSMGDPALRREIQGLLRRLAGKPEEYILKLNLLRSLKRAQYATRPAGHYGLAKADYTHFTSPIRRYADLMVHRALPRTDSRSSLASAPQSSSHKKVPPSRIPRLAPRIPSSSVLESIAHHCSTTERIADEAEKEAVKLKLLEFFERKIREHKLETFDALITEVRNFGLFIELPNFMLSGMIHVSTLEDDFYQFDPTQQTLTGKKTRRLLRAGGHVRVEVSRVDRFKKQVDFCLTGDQPN